MSGRIYLRIEMDGKSVTRLNSALRLLGEKDAPFLREALDDVGHRLAAEVRSRAPGSIGAKVVYSGVKGTGASLRAVGVDRHPGAKSMEFGRRFYWAGWTGRRRGKGSIKRGGATRRRSAGQAARPFIGVKDGGHAMGAVQPYARVKLMSAIEAEWARLAGGGAA